MSVLPRGLKTASPISDLASSERVLLWRAPCPSCGGPVEMRSERRVADCSFCGTRFVVAGTHRLAQYVPHTLSTEQGLVAIKRWLRQEGHRATRIGEPARVLVPFWWVRRRVMWWQSTHGKEVSGSAKTYEASLEDVERLAPAFDCLALGEEPPVGSGEVRCIPLSPGLVPEDVDVIAPPEEPPAMAPLRASERPAGADATDEAFDPFAGDGLPFDEEHEPFGSESSAQIEIVHESDVASDTMLLYLPYFALRFTFRGEHHTVLACGRTGAVTGVLEGVFLDAHPPLERDGLSSLSGIPRLVPFGCPECGRTLSPAIAELSAWVCGACERHWRHESSGLVDTASRIAEGEGRLLPFWRLVETGRLGGMREPSVHVEESAANAPQRVALVPAFGPIAPSLVRRLALLMTATPPGLSTAARVLPKPPGVVGDAPRACELPARAAKKIAAMVVDEMECERSATPDAGGVSFDGSEPQLFWVPFAREDGYLVHAPSGARLPASALEAAG